MAANTRFASPQQNGTVGSRADLELFGNELSVAEHHNLIHLDNALHQRWSLGENMLLGWAPHSDGIALLIAPHWFLADLIHHPPGETSDPIDEFCRQLVVGRKEFSLRKLKQVASILESAVSYIELPAPLSGREQERHAIERIVRRYGINYSENRAAVLFDVVNFSLLTPFQQMTQLNSLSYSINSAHSRMLDREIDINFARSTTGDGFYIWNRDEGENANANLYHLMNLVLADNAIAQRKGKRHVAPSLRACFHVGSSYEFHQSEGLSPTLYSYLVGDVTIELARLIEKALPGQILVGDFRSTAIHETTSAPAVSSNSSTVRFVSSAQEDLYKLKGLELSGEPIDSIKCYLTGSPIANGEFTVRRLSIKDKHGLSHHAFNAKMNIYRGEAEPIYLGIEDRKLAEAEA
ncbi:MAG: hypothetical protein AAF438_02465 [Pseudomonadota bacterium]